MLKSISDIYTYNINILRAKLKKITTASLIIFSVNTDNITRSHSTTRKRSKLFRLIACTTVKITYY